MNIDALMIIFVSGRYTLFYLSALRNLIPNNMSLLKKLLFASLLFVNFPVDAQQNLRLSVGFIRHDYTEIEECQHKTVSDFLTAHNFDAAAKSLTPDINKIASAFVCRINNKLRIITEYKNVDGAEYVEFCTVFNGDTIKYPHLKIIKAIKDKNIAIISAPENFVPEEYPRVLSANIKNGDPVYSAGYAKKDSSSSWMLNKGKIINFSGFDSFSNQTKTNVIRHTATVHEGMSGGPLLIQLDKEFVIIGINTFNQGDKGTVYSAISAKEIFYAELPEITFVSSDHHLKFAAESFANIINSGAADSLYALYISDKYIMNLSPEQLDNLAGSLSKSTINLLRKGYAVDGLKKLVVESFIDETDSKNPLTLTDCVVFSNTAVSTYTAANTKFITHWVSIDDNPMMYSSQTQSLIDSSSNRVSVNSELREPHNLLGFGYTFFGSDFKSVNIYYSFVKKYVFAGCELSPGFYSKQVPSIDSTGQKNMKTKDYSLFYAGITAGVGYPIKAGSKYIIKPYAEYKFGFQASNLSDADSTETDSETAWGGRYKAGISFERKIKSGNKIYIDLNASFMPLKMDAFDIDKFYKGVGLGIGFMF